MFKALSIGLCLSTCLVNANNVTELIRACADGNLEEVKKLIEIDKVDVNSQEPESLDTALHIAAGKSLDLVKYLRSKGARIDIKNKHDLTPLVSAVFSNNFPVVQYLVENGANVNVKIAEAPLLSMAFSLKGVNPEVINFLISQGAESSDIMNLLTSVIMSHRPPQEAIQMIDGLVQNKKTTDFILKVPLLPNALSINQQTTKYSIKTWHLSYLLLPFALLFAPFRVIIHVINLSGPVFPIFVYSILLLSLIGFFTVLWGFWNILKRLFRKRT